MKTTVTSPPLPSQAGSQTPGLEGAPRSASHENRMTSVMPASKPLSGLGKEGSVSKL